VTVDGRVLAPDVMKGIDCYSIFLPSGDHTTTITTGDTFTYGVSITSFWSSTAIAIFGILAIVLIVGMYLVLKILKRSNRFQRTPLA
jgi:ABC-type antimicrobial peptide transport system permease subunit